MDMQPERPTFFTPYHALDTQIELNEGFDAIDTPEGFKSHVQLYPHQATVVKALVDVEDRRVVTVRTTDYDEITSGEVKIETSAMVLSEPFGSGKTIEILAMILVRPIPKAYPVHANSITIKVEQPRDRYRRGDKPKQLFRHEIVRKFTGPDALIRPNLIVVGSSVLVQWENAIKEFTNLKCFVVGDYYRLQQFLQMYRSGKVKAYDIILLKNGKVTGNFVLPGEDPSQTKDYRSLISVIGKMTANSCWSRVIYDDFDTISIPPGSGAINALFTVYVSATTKAEPMGKTPIVKYNSILDAVRERTVPLNLVVKDKSLFTNFNIRNTAEFVEASTKIPIINGFRYVYNNPDDNYIRLLGAMGEQDANNIMEMLNGDAIGTAAEALGIKTTSVADIFQRMLDKKYEKYLHDQDVLETLDKVRKNVLPTLEPHFEDKQHSGAELDAIRSQICKKQIPNPKYYSTNLERLIDELTVEFQQAKEQDGMAINRVIDNIKEGECQVCRLPLEEFDTFIVRCCGLIVCDVCGIKGSNLSKRYNYRLKAETIYGSCANCKAEVFPQTDLIFVDRNFNMEALLTAKGDEKPAEPLPEVAVEETVEDDTPKEPEIKNPKLKALRAIIRGEVPDAREEISIKIPHLIQGRVDNPAPADAERKVLVFANYNETLNLVESFLVEQGITFLRLGGTYQEKAATVKKFKTYGQVMLINSQQHCAGLHLSFASDLVFMHHILDQAVSSQVCGRIQRIGRIYNGKIHFLCYKNEAARV